MSSPESGANEPAVRADKNGIGFLLNQAARGVRAQVASRLREHGISDNEFIVLRNAAELHERTGDPALTTDIAERLHLSISDVEEASAALERDGWVETTRAGGAYHVVPTHKGLALMPVLQDAARWSLETALNGFSREEIASLTEMLRRLVHNSDAMLREPRG
jgi:DNA-binding MarR family transcriptional regulator